MDSTVTNQTNDIETGNANVENDWDTNAPNTSWDEIFTNLDENSTSNLVPLATNTPLPPIAFTNTTSNTTSTSSSNTTSTSSSNSTNNIPHGFLSPGLISEITFTQNSNPLTPPAGTQFNNLFAETNILNNLSPYIFTGSTNIDNASNSADTSS